MVSWYYVFITSLSTQIERCRAAIKTMWFLTWNCSVLEKTVLNGPSFITFPPYSSIQQRYVTCKLCGCLTFLTCCRYANVLCIRVRLLHCYRWLLYFHTGWKWFFISQPKVIIIIRQKLYGFLSFIPSASVSSEAALNYEKQITILIGILVFNGYV